MKCPGDEPTNLPTQGPSLININHGEPVSEYIATQMSRSVQPAKFREEKVDGRLERHPATECDCLVFQEKKPEFVAYLLVDWESRDIDFSFLCVYRLHLAAVAPSRNRTRPVAESNLFGFVMQSLVSVQDVVPDSVTDLAWHAEERYFWTGKRGRPVSAA